MYQYPGFYNFRVRYTCVDGELVIEYPYMYNGVWVKDSAHYQERVREVRKDYLTKDNLVIDGRITS